MAKNREIDDKELGKVSGAGDVKISEEPGGVHEGGGLKDQRRPVEMAEDGSGSGGHQDLEGDAQSHGDQEIGQN